MQEPSWADQGYLRTQQYGTRSNLDARASLHQRFSTASTTFPDFASALVNWSADADVLECGCGTGLFWGNQTTPRSVNLRLTDFSAKMVVAAVASATENGFAKVEGAEHDVQDLPFESSSVDVAIANHMLYHVPDPRRAVSELARVLRSDGVLLASTNGTDHMREMTDAIAAVFGDQDDPMLAKVFGIETGAEILEQCFGVVRWHDYENELVVTDLDAALAYGLSFPPGDAATEAQKSELRAALADRMKDGALRIQIQSGAFVCEQPRRA